MSVVFFRHRMPVAVFCLCVGLTLSACGGGDGDASVVAKDEDTISRPTSDDVEPPDPPPVRPEVPAGPSDPHPPTTPEPPAPVVPPPPEPPAPPPEPPAPPPEPPAPPPEPPAPPEPIDLSLTLRNVAGGDALCLALSTTHGADVGFETCSGTDAQRWRMERDGNEYFRIRNVLADAQGRNVCLRAAPGDTPIPAAVTMSPCDGDYPATRLWRGSTLAPDGVFTIFNKDWSDQGRRASLMAYGKTLAMVTEADQPWPPALWRYEGEVPILIRRVAGVDRVLFMTARFAGQTANPVEPIRQAVFGDATGSGSLAQYLELASRGKFAIRGDAELTDVDLGAVPAGCSSADVLARARAGALARGVDAGKFNLLFVDFPSTGECKFAGLAARPGSWILSNGSGNGYWMWTHEFGHAMGMAHPDTLRNCPVKDGAVMVGAGCETGGTDDPTDTVGGGGRRMYPVNYQLFAGWLSEEDVPAIVKPGTYRLAPLWSTLPGKQGYRLPRGDGSTLILEFRRPQGKRGSYEDWPDTSPFVNGVTVRIMRYLSNVSIRNTLIDATPGSADGMKDAPLMPGKSLFDTLSGRRITVLSADEGGAVVRVE
ncbi:RICIN domain-containing protein [Burkholderia sola]|uniref:RICIN domain-containing protein n=1 Tax=Burkholderia sola TaxID=2843302 RepID=UPI00338DF496